MDFKEKMIPSPYATVGPYFPTQFSDGTNDLTLHDAKTARGQHIVVTGAVLEEGGKPTVNTIVEIWQADAGGLFRHPDDPRAAEADPGFYGWGRCRTDSDGRYSFRTVMPGAYAERSGQRRPHINVMLLAIGLTRRLVTTVFFEEGSDPVLDCVPAELRPRLVARRGADMDGLPAYHFDLVLRGEGETPFFLD
jgi:protocatechuate 3,4-dioxygenase alpha subunit